MAGQPVPGLAYIGLAGTAPVPAPPAVAEPLTRTLEHVHCIPHYYVARLASGLSGNLVTEVRRISPILRGQSVP